MSQSYALRPSQLVELLTESARAKDPVMVVGEPGVGKTQLMHAAIRQLNAAGTKAMMIIGHAATEDPTVPAGLPFMSKDGTHAQFMPFGNMYRALTEASKYDVIVYFLDDFGQASATVQSAYMQLILGGELNGTKLPANVVFMIATNDRKHRANVTGILEPVKSRCTTIVYLKPDLDEWCQWAYSTNGLIPADMIAFLRLRSDLFSKFEPTADLKNSPNPRTWENAARVVNKNMSKETTFASLVGAVGDEAAVTYSAFREMMQHIPNIDAILMTPDSAAIPERPEILYTVAASLAMRATQKNFSRIATYCERLIANNQGEFAALCVRDSLRRTENTPENVANTAEFVKLASGPLGDLLK